LTVEHRLAGSDTIATAIRAIVLNIITSQHVYSTLQVKIDTAIANNKISSPIVRDSEARTLPYLQAVIKEGLRIHPPATGLASKVAPPAGDTINGVFIPGGTKVGANYWAVLRRKDIFGSDADAFRPERWLEASAEQLAKMDKARELVWGYGRYICLWRGVALLELNKILVEVGFLMIHTASIFWGLQTYLLTFWVQFLRNFD
jgi:cytochrome P450